MPRGLQKFRPRMHSLNISRALLTSYSSRSIDNPTRTRKTDPVPPLWVGKTLYRYSAGTSSYILDKAAPSAASRIRLVPVLYPPGCPLILSACERFDNLFFVMSLSRNPRSSLEGKGPDIDVYQSPETVVQRWLKGVLYHSSGGRRPSDVSTGAASKMQKREQKYPLFQRRQDHQMSKPSWHGIERSGQTGKLFRTEGQQVQYADPARFTDDQASRQSILFEKRSTSTSGSLSSRAAGA